MLTFSQGRGYRFEPRSGKYVKQPSAKPFTHPALSDAEFQSSDENSPALEVVRTDDDVTAPFLQDETVKLTNAASPEIERIMEYRVQRQYLVQWKGETEEQATWVDEDVFPELTRMSA
ncbi:hypothetical protein RvY_10877 [Ramazzottius varieornatus]|uniref:Chromo domain-containing protein n=1 Tax=Ramazzottius varieornatus TaxID=947166 RepID=A0A1D1VE79_RAMVA|nr:hypothetical protein RvY_10877 [Ramazzottius varieornatus]